MRLVISEQKNAGRTDDWNLFFFATRPLALCFVVPTTDG